jgi:DNA polymerase III sliding clamp (beta) subunit (PCNA family)
MLLNKASLEIAALASNDPSRLALGGVYVTDGKTVATNGHYIGVVTTPKGSMPPTAEFPCVKAGVVETDEQLKPCIIPTADALALAKAIPTEKGKGRTHLPILRNALVDVAYSNVNGQFRAVTTDLDREQVACINKIEGEFPDYEQVLPTGTPTVTIGFNVAYLEKVAKTMQRCGVEKAVKVELFDSDRAAVFSGTNGDGQEVKIVLMPMRL